MKKVIIVSLICVLVGFMMFACQRNRGVYAGSDSDTYQPRPAPKVPVNQGMKGELLRIDTPTKTISVRVENGMVQTFKVDDNTIVLGLENQPSVRGLVGKEGSEVTIQWREDNGAKMASNIEVTQVSTAKSVKRPARKH